MRARRSLHHVNLVERKKILKFIFIWTWLRERKFKIGSKSDDGDVCLVYIQWNNFYNTLRYKNIYRI